MSHSRFSQNNHSATELMEELTHLSFSHEYALMNFSESDFPSDKESFLSEMEDCRRMYLEIRKKLELIAPEKLLDLEIDILSQKQTIFSTSHLTLQ